MNATPYGYEETEWQPRKRPLWWRLLKPLLILALPIGILALAAVPLSLG